MTAAKLPHLNRAQRRALDRAARRRKLAEPKPLPDLPRPIRTARPRTPVWLIVGAMLVGLVSVVGIGGYVIADAAGLLPSGGITYTCPKGASCAD